MPCVMVMMKPYCGVLKYRAKSLWWVAGKPRRVYINDKSKDKCELEFLCASSLQLGSIWYREEISSTALACSRALWADAVRYMNSADFLG